MVADGMTKPLDRIAFQRFKDLMGMTERDGAQRQEELRTVRHRRRSASEL